jgi:hypothetical protein
MGREARIYEGMVLHGGGNHGIGAMSGQTFDRFAVIHLVIDDDRVDMI